MKPFALIATRPEAVIADAEYEQFLKRTGLTAEQLKRIRFDSLPLPHLNPSEYSGVFIAGSPYNASDAPDVKTPLQREVEIRLGTLLDELIELDTPVFGACYGVGTLGLHHGGVIDGTYGEEAGVVEVSLTEEGARDPLIVAASLPQRFHAIVGHKEAVRTLPDDATLLVTGEACPVQMFRVGSKQYATQFHPELDKVALMERLWGYRNAGYLDPEAIETLSERITHLDTSASSRLLRAFVEQFATDE